MANSTTYDEVLEQAQQLPREQRLLLAVALVGQENVPSEIRNLRNITAHSPRPLTEAEKATVDAYFAKLDALAEDIGKAAKDDVSAVESVREQRRDL